MDHTQTIADIVTWAEGEPYIQAVVLTGSGARGELDALSDLDVELYVDDPDVLLGNNQWYQQFGTVLVVEALENVGSLPTRLVYYVGGKIDFTIGAVYAAARAYQRPYQVLVDKTGITGCARMNVQLAKTPGEKTFIEHVNWFYAAALMNAKYVVRGEPWLADVRDHEMDAQLLKMIEWYHVARYGDAFDVWYLGAHMMDWMDADILAELEGCWEIREYAASSILGRVELYSRLCAQTSIAWGYTPYDVTDVHAEIRRILATCHSNTSRE